MVTYPSDTSKWEDWQRDYRLGLILIMPPEEVSRKIDPLRAKYDPYAFAICPTHISVSDPLQMEMTLEKEDEIRDILSSIQPFLIYFDEIYASPDYSGVIFPIRPREPIDALKTALHTASVFSGEIYSRRYIPPHMTIAEFISIEDGLKLCAQLRETVPRGSFVCDNLEFIVPDDDFHFQKKLTFYLTGRLSERMVINISIWESKECLKRVSQYLRVGFSV